MPKLSMLMNAAFAALTQATDRTTEEINVVLRI
jgi:hypothetical protein